MIGRNAGIQQLLSTVNTNLLELLPLSGSEAKEIATLMARYKDLRPQFADACLVHLAQREQIDTIFTLDRRDFSVYRAHGKRPFQLVP